MGKASRKKRPIKAKARKSSLGFTIVIVTIVVLGGVGIALSRSGGGGSSDGTPPTLNDHWHTAYVVNICGTEQPNLAQPARLLGLHTHSDGLIHVEPYVTASVLDRGDNATLARFVQGEPGFRLTATEVQVPGGKLMKNGDLCDGKDPGKVTIRQWKNANSDEFKDYTNPKDVKITDGGAVTIAFLPAGRDIPKPHSTIPNLANPNAGEAQR